MKLVKLVLVGYRRLMLNNIKSLTYTPTSLYQLVLGTNGSGKSSVIYEISPLPGNPADYIKTGSKVSVWEHRGLIYELSTTFKSGTKNSFLKDGVECNPGGTASVQKELVKQEFGITSDIHELLIDQETFTSMTSSKRSEWITLLCDTDFTFALNLYNNVRKAGRDAQGAYKHLSGRLTQETARLKALGESDQWADEAKLLQDELEVLFTNKSNRQLSGGMDTLKQLQQYECNIAEQMLAIGRPVPSKYKFTCQDDLTQAVQRAVTDLDLLNHSLTWTTEALEDLVKLQKTVESSGVADVGTAGAELDRLQAETQKLISTLNQYQYLPEYNAYAAVLSIESIKEDLINLLREIPDNGERQFNKAAVDTAREELRSTKERANLFLNKIAKEEATLEHLAGVCKVECPKCSHNWLPNNTEDHVQMATRTLESFQKEHQTLSSRVVELEQYLEAAQEFSGYFQRFRGMVSNNPSLKAFWDRILENDGINTRAKHWILEFSLFTEDVAQWFEISKLNEQTQRLTLALDAMKNVSGVGQLAEHISEHQTKISILTQDLVTAQRHLATLKKANVEVNGLMKLNDELTKVSGKKRQAYEDYLVEVKDSAIGHVTRQHQNRLAFLNAKLSEKKTLEDLLDDLTESRNNVEQDMHTYKLLADELSPSDGLIADQLGGFIRAFTEHLNTIISNVWTYEMPVLPCGQDSGVLDYKFPLRIKESDTPVPDISRGSTGQKEIINFAFKLIVMFYLRLTDYPLYLDELGHSFDEQHRINVMNFVKDLVETKGFSQVFMISHYASSHGAFTQAEVLVMDSTNIAVPMKYNQHAILA